MAEEIVKRRCLRIMQFSDFALGGIHSYQNRLPCHFQPQWDSRRVKQNDGFCFISRFPRCISYPEPPVNPPFCKVRWKKCVAEDCRCRDCACDHRIHWRPFAVYLKGPACHPSRSGFYTLIVPRPTLATFNVGIPMKPMSFVLVALALGATTPGFAQETDPMLRANPQMKAVLAELQALGGKPIETLSPVIARKQPTHADAAKSLLKKQGKSTQPEAVAKVEDKSIPGADGQIAIRIYTPGGEGPFPVIVYFHGGGWVIADLDTYDSTPRALANAAQAVVVSSRYRQAPEHPFPASHEDAFGAYKWVQANASSLKGDANRIAVAGESAGGNLAAAVCLMAREQKVHLPVHQLLVYPVAGTDPNTPSAKENANAKPLNNAMMEWFAKHEFQKPEDTQDPRIDLLKADLSGMPPATVITAQIDPLQSAGKALADRLEAAGVKTSYKNFDGVTHEFFGMTAVLDDAKEAMNFAAAELKSAFRIPEAVGAPGEGTSIERGRDTNRVQRVFPAGPRPGKN